MNTTPKKEKDKIRANVQNVYEAKGQSEAFDWVNAWNKNHIKTIPFENCKGCETSSPSLDHCCLICGQETTPTVFRITYRMEVYVEAETEAEAREKFENMTLTKKNTSFVELVSVDEE